MKKRESTIIYKINYEIKDKIKEQLEWSKDNECTFSNLKINFDIERGSLLIFEVYDHYKHDFSKCLGVALNDVNKNDNAELIVCPIVLCSKNNAPNVSGISIGRINCIDLLKEAKALIHKIKPIDKTQIKILFDKLVNKPIKLEEIFLKKIIINYSNMLSKFCDEEEKIMRVGYC